MRKPCSSWLKFLTIAAVVLCSVRPAAAQGIAQETVPTIEFDAAIQRALDKNPAIAQAATAIPRAEALVLQSRALIRPNVGASFSNTTLDSARGFSGGVTQPQNQSTLSADITVPVVNLSRWANIPQARDQVEIARMSTADVRHDIAVATAQAYLAVISARRQVEVDQRAVENSHAHLEYSQRRFQGGIGSRLNELRAASATSAAEAHLENSRLSVRRAQEALGVLIAADGPMDAGAEPVFEMPTVADEQEWMQARSDVRLQLASQHAAERVLRDTWRDWIGTATAQFSPFVVAPAGLFQPTNSWRMTLSFTQPIFEGGQKRAAMHLREIAVEQNKIAMTGIELQARSDVRVARVSVDSYQAAFEKAQQAATQAAEVLRITTSAFEVGATTNIEVIDAQRSTRDFESAAALAEDAVRRAKLDLLVAMGRFPK
jgi:outer membrane protein, multidrug efflux system